MELVIREVQLSEIELVAIFLSNQFQKGFERLHIKQNKIINFFKVSPSFPSYYNTIKHAFRKEKTATYMLQSSYYFNSKVSHEV